MWKEWAITHIIIEVPRYFLGAPVVLLREQSETPGLKFFHKGISQNSIVLKQCLDFYRSYSFKKLALGIVRWKTHSTQMPAPLSVSGAWPRSLSYTQCHLQKGTNVKASKMLFEPFRSWPASCSLCQAYQHPCGLSSCHFRLFWFLSGGMDLSKAVIAGSVVC